MLKLNVLEDVLHVPQLLNVMFVNQGTIKPRRVSVILAIHYVKHVMVLLKPIVYLAIKATYMKITNAWHVLIQIVWNVKLQLTAQNAHLDIMNKSKMEGLNMIAKNAQIIVSIAMMETVVINVNPDLFGLILLKHVSNVP